MTFVLSALAVAYAVFLVIAVLAQRHAYFPGRYMEPGGPGVPPPDIEVLWLDIGGGERVEAWLAIPRQATPDAPAPLAVYLHGNAEFIDDNTWIIDVYREFGLAVLLVEYRGYGRSGGAPSEAAISRDAADFIDIARARPAIDDARLVIHGRSIGAGLSARLIAVYRPDAVIVQSSFLSMRAMLARHGVPPFLARDPMRIDRAIAHHRGPVLIMHNTSDAIIPISHARKLRDLATLPTFIEGSGDHDDLPRSLGEYTGVIGEFLARSVSRAGAHD